MPSIRRTTIVAGLCFALGCNSGSLVLDDDDEPPPGALDSDQDGYPEDDDCDDGDAAVHPGADEVTDGLDNDCDGHTDSVLVCDDGSEEYDSIQGAIDAVDAGMEIRICPGTWREDLSIQAKQVSLISTAGAADTIVEGTSAGPVVLVADVAQRVSISELTLRGWGAGGVVACSGSLLTLTGNVVVDGDATNGGGFAASACGVELVDNEFSDNVAAEYGGGALLFECTGEVRGNTFDGNIALEGGGLVVSSGQVLVVENTIRWNVATTADELAHGSGGGGGGLWVYGEDLEIEDNLVRENTSYFNGGGIFVLQGAGELRGNEVVGNVSYEDGGGIYTNMSTVTIAANEVRSNEAYDDGGGIRIFIGNSTIQDNVMESNSAADDGGGLKASHAHNSLVDNEFVDNGTGDAGGGLELDNDASHIVGCTFVGNVAARGAGLHSNDAIEGLVIEDSSFDDNEAWVEGGGLLIENDPSLVTLLRLDVTDNEAPDGAGLRGVASTLDIFNCSFASNRSSGAGGGVSLEGIAGVLGNAVVTDNQSMGGLGAGLAITEAPDLTVVNTIVTENDGGGVAVVGAAPSWLFNDTWDNAGGDFAGFADPSGSDGNISADPRLDAALGLESTSPCIDTGAPSLTDPDGSRSDMGINGGPHAE